MLSIAPIAQSPQKASGYYMKEEKNYYLSDTGVGNRTKWLGELANRYGLKGEEVTQDMLEKVLSGSSPDGSQAIKNANDENRKAGWDFTLSAPKSASIMALVYGDKRFLEAHDLAVQLTAEEIEKNCAQVRISTDEGQIFQNTSNAMIAAIRHATSREGDPQVHTHLLVANMSEDKAGTLRAMSSTTVQKHGVVNGFSERVYHDQKYYTAFYQSAFAHLASKTCDVEFETFGNGLSEIKGFSSALKEGFSKRRQNIEKLASELGVHSAKGMDLITQASKKDKSLASMDELVKKWREEAKGYEPNFNGQLEKKENQPILPSKIAKEALTHAVNHLSEIKTSFRVEKLLETSINLFGSGKGLDIQSLQNELEGLIKSAQLIPLQNGQFASKVALDKEQSLIESLDKKSKYMSSEINEECFNRLNLMDKNKSTIENLFKSGKKVNVVDVRGDRVGLIESLLVSSEKEINVISPNRSYLADLTGIKSHVKDDGLFKCFFKSNSEKQFHTLYHALDKGYDFKDKLLVIDQAQRLNFKDMQTLIDKANESQAKLILINQTDTSRQVLKGDVMDAVKKGNVYQDSYHIQHNINTKVKLFEEKDTKKRYALLVDEYLNLLKNPKTQSQDIKIVSANTKELDKLNPMIREALKNEGLLSRDEKEIDTIKPIFLSDAQKKVSHSFQRGFLVALGDKQYTPNYKIQGIDHGKNTLLLRKINNQSISHLKGKRLFQSKTNDKLKEIDLSVYKENISLFKRQQINLSLGDKIRISGINNGLSITGISEKKLFVVDNEGDKKIVNLSDIALKNISYNYSSGVDQALNTNRFNSFTLALVPSYMASKDMLGNLSRQSPRNLMIFTDNEKSLLKGFSQSKTRISSIERVLKSSNEPLTRVIDDTTSSALKNDIDCATQSLKSDYLDKKDTTNTLDAITKKATFYAISYLSDTEAAFRQQDVVKNALKQAMREYNTPLLPEHINDVLHQLEKKGDLLSKPYTDGTRWVTKESYLCEKAIIKLVEGGKDKVSPLLKEDKVLSLLGDNKLTQGQKEAIRLITTTKNRFVGIQGLAGTGKSTMLASVQDLLTIEDSLKKADDKIEIIGLAPTHQAVGELNNKGLKAQTVQSLLYGIDQMTESKLLGFKNTLFVLDESSMMNNTDMLKFTKMVDRYNLRAVPIGDIKQIKGISQGKPFEVLQHAKALDIAYMNNIIRQKEIRNQNIHIKGDDQLLKSVKDISQNKVKSSIERLKDQKNADHISYRENRSVYQKILQIDELESYITKNVISTYKDKESSDKVLEGSDTNKSKDQNKKSDKEATNQREEAYTKMIKGAAFDYLSRTDGTRANTLVIAYSRRTCGEITKLIRAGLVRDKTLENFAKTTHLVALDLTNTEKKMNLSSYKQDCIICESGKTYYAIKQVDEINRTVELINLKTNDSKIIKPESIDAKRYSFYKKEETKIAENDRVVMRKTDLSKDYNNNESFIVGSTKDDEIILNNEQKTIRLKKDQLEDMHWSYDYVKTVNSVQGMTAKYTIGVDDPESPLANLTRLYVALSRATDHYRMYTSEDKKLLLKVLQDDGDKYSSLEVLREFITEKNREDKTLDNILFEQNKDGHSLTDSKSLQSNKTPKISKQKDYFDKDKVLNALNENCENVVISLLGQPNQKHSDSKVWAFGSKTGSLRVTMSGKYRGHWRDWYGSDTKGTSDHGNLLTLIMREEGLSFKEAVERGAKLAYVTPEVKDISSHLLKKSDSKKITKNI